MAFNKRETFSEITIKVTEDGVVGEMKTSLEVHDSETGEVFGGKGHRQVVPLDDITKVVNTPSGPKSVADIIGSINADIAATNLNLAGQRDAAIAERDTAVADLGVVTAERDRAVSEANELRQTPPVAP